MASTTRSPATGRQRRAAVEAQLLDAVESLLGEGVSFTELSVARLAKRAGIARSTFYLYFPDKADVAVRLSENLARSAFELLAPWDPGRPDAPETYRATLLAVIGYYRTRAAALAAVLEVGAYDETVRRAWESQLEVFDATAQQLLREEQRAGRTAADIDVVTASRLFIWGGMQTITHQVLFGDPARDADIARELAAQQWFGVFRRPAQH